MYPTTLGPADRSFVTAIGFAIVFIFFICNPMPFAHGRWERLQLSDIYVIHPDGSGLKKITMSGDFCGRPKWLGDSGHVIPYCMTAEQTLANRRPSPYPGNDTRLMSIDAATGASAELKTVVAKFRSEDRPSPSR